MHSKMDTLAVIIRTTVIGNKYQIVTTSGFDNGKQVNMLFRAEAVE